MFGFFVYACLMGIYGVEYNIIATEVVYVKYKTIYKTKLMALNCCLFLPNPSMLAMMHIYSGVYRAADGGMCCLQLQVSRGIIS